nr:hypothetical protein [Clostridia bacterium]
MFTTQERAAIIALLEKGVINEVNGKIAIGQAEYGWDICRYTDRWTGEARFCPSVSYETMESFHTAAEAMESLEAVLDGMRACEKVIDALLLMH